MSSTLLRLLPDALDRVELGRVGRQAEELDAMAIGREPRFAVGVEVVARAIIDDEEDLPTGSVDEVLEEV